MNASEWRKCTDLRQMLPYLKTKTSNRKKRLFAVACCRRIWQLMGEDRCQRLLLEAGRFGALDDPDAIRPDFLLSTLAEAERHADGLADAAALAQAAEVAHRLEQVKGYYYACYDPSWGEVDHDLMATCEAAGAVYQASDSRVDVTEAAACAARATYRAAGGDDSERTDESESAAQCRLVRDLRPHPSGGVTIRTDRRERTVASLAQAAYGERTLPSGELDLARLAVLADALEEAGCTDEDILSHLRSAGPHVRGCWALDLLLDKQ